MSGAPHRRSVGARYAFFSRGCALARRGPRQRTPRRRPRKEGVEALVRHILALRTGASRLHSRAVGLPKPSSEECMKVTSVVDESSGLTSDWRRDRRRFAARAGRTAAKPAAQPRPPRPYTAKTPWGDPDLQGVWDYKTITPLERPANYGRPPVPDRRRGRAARSERRRSGSTRRRTRTRRRHLVHAPYMTDPWPQGRRGPPHVAHRRSAGRPQFRR